MKTILGVAALTLALAPAASDNGFDHGYTAYAELLADYVVGDRVDYARLKNDRDRLDAIVADFGAVTEEQERRWTREQRLAYSINAYNLYTLQVIVDHYPIRGSLLSIHPRNSIRQIDGVWTKLTWQSARAP